MIQIVIDQLKLVTLSSVSFAVFLLTIWVLRKKTHFHFNFVLLASFLPLISLVKSGAHQSGDFLVNLYKTSDLFNSIQSGIFPAHWAANLNATYGYPLFLFTYPLPYYSIALLKLIGFTYIASEKLVISFAFIASGLFIYAFLRQFFTLKSSLFGAILYLFAPYHLVDLHFRVAIGELFAYAFLPAVLLGTVKLSKEQNKVNFMLLSICYSALILSHQAIALISTPFILLIPLFFRRSQRKLIFSYGAMAISILITAFYWLPVIEGTRHTLQTEYAKTISFESVGLYFISPWRFGFLYQGPIGQLSFPSGIVQIGSILFLIFMFFKGKLQKKHKKIAFIVLILTFFLFSMLFPLTEPLWKTLPLMTNFQFSYRLMLPISLLLAIAGALVSSYIKNRIILYALVFIAITSTILNWGPRATIKNITDKDIINKAPYSTYLGEGLQPAAPIDRRSDKIWESTPPKTYLEVASGEASISSFLRTPITHSYLVSAKQTSSFIENTYYFPGWQLYVNDKPHKIQWQDKSKSNKIRFTLPRGDYYVNLKFENTPVVVFSNSVSVIGILLLFIYLLIPHRRR